MNFLKNLGRWWLLSMLYIVLLFMITMGTDSCGPTNNSCTILYLGIGIGCLLLIPSYLYATMSIFANKPFNPQPNDKLSQILSPQRALPIFIVIMIIAAIFDRFFK